MLVKALTEWMQVFMRRSMHTFFLYSRHKGLSVSQIAALSEIRRMGSSNVSSIGSELEITSPAASQLLERLVQQGLVLRAEDPHDRRLKQMTLTKQGEAILQEGMQARQKWLEALADSMTPQEQEQVVGALKILLEKAGALEHQAAPEA